MLPVRLEIRNFLAYRTPEPLEFDGVHLACLTGPNGAGKSSLLDAITWALWGKARLRSDDDLIHQGQTEMMVQLDFLQGDCRYRVVRRRQMGKTARQGRSTLDLWVWDEAKQTWQQISAPSIRETDRKIVELLRLDYETFIHSAFLQQGRADAFTTKPPRERKEILGSILGLDQWQTYEERAKKQLRSIEQELTVIALRLQEIETQEAEEPELLRQLDLATAALDDAIRLREEAEELYDEVAGAEEQMSAAQTHLAAAEQRVRQREADLREIEQDLERQREKLAQVQEVLAERESIESGYAQLQAARQADQALGEKLQAMSAIKDRLNEVVTAINKARADLEAEAKVHRDRIASAQRTADELERYQSELADMQSEVKALEAEEQRRDELREEIGRLKEELASLDATNKALYVEMQELKTRIKELEAAEATCPLCGQPLDEKHKGELLQDLQAQGTARGDQYRANVARMEEIEAAIREHKDVIAEIEIALRALPARRERAASLRASADQAHDAAEIIQREAAALAAIEQMIASGEYAQELQQQRDAIQAEIDALGYDSDAHNAARETLSTYHEFEARQRALEAAEAQLPELESALASAEARRERWLVALAEEQAAVEAARLEIAGLQDAVDEARRREEEMRRRRSDEGRAREQVIRVQQALSAIEAARKRREDLETKRAKLAERQAIYETLRDAFGKNGIPAMMIEAAIPELEENANLLLSRMTNGRMHVRLDTQREKKTGGVQETLDILISDELGTRAYESYSGGEAFRVNFAIRIALSQMLARRAGAQLRTLFMDEGFGTQDENGRQRLVEAITAVQDNFDLLLVITHVEDLRDAFPVQIEVQKTADGSRVSMH